MDLPFCYWFHENEFHRLSLRCLHSQKLWNQILRREKQRREGRKGENELLRRTRVTRRKCTTRLNIIKRQIPETTVGEHICKVWTRQTLSPLNQKFDEICHIIKGTRGPLLQKDNGETAQSSSNEIQGARARHLNFIKCILCSFFIEISVYNKPSFLC